jgi:hypothetical protein
MNNLELLIGLVAIALAIFFGLWGFRKGIGDQLSTIKDAVVAIRTTVDKTWDLVVVRFGVSGGTIVRELDKLGKVRITAEPGEKETSYLIEIEKPILHEDYFVKIAKRGEFLEKRRQFFDQEIYIIASSPNRLRIRLPSSDPKTCSEFMTFVLKWLNSTYVESLKEIKEFEEPILT